MIATATHDPVDGMAVVARGQRVSHRAKKQLGIRFERTGTSTIYLSSCGQEIVGGPATAKVRRACPRCWGSR